MIFPAHREPEPPPPVTPGFEGVQRAWDPMRNRWTAKILPGQSFVTRYDEFITTDLGSCVSVCIRDPVLRLGGMNHFMLPTPPVSESGAASADPDGLAVRYCRNALARLIDELEKLGADRDRLRAKMYGGGRHISRVNDLGARTIALARKYLREQHLPVVAVNLGDSHPQRLVYCPSSGMALLQRLPARYAVRVAIRDMRYFESLERECFRPDAGFFSIDRGPHGLLSTAPRA